MKLVSTDRAPQAIGPYSQAVVAGSLVFTAGQIALDPATMTLVEGGVGEQAAQVMLNLKEVLEASGTGLQNVVKTTMYLRDMADFQAANEVYARHFGNHRPARSALAVKELPKGALIEIDAVAFKP